MLSIRFHGRGGQGMKTASRLVGRSFFIAGHEVQDGQRYGAERRGAPMTAYARISHEAIHHRGIVSHPDLLVVADHTLFAQAAAGVMAGASSCPILVLTSLSLAELANIFSHDAPVVRVAEDDNSRGFSHGFGKSAACAGAALALADLPFDFLERAIVLELDAYGKSLVQANIEIAARAHGDAAATGLKLRSISLDRHWQDPDWIDLPFEEAGMSAPAIHGAETSSVVKTGDWRIMRPLVQAELCNGCGLCAVYCPDGVVEVGPGGVAVVDYFHCKGCLICMVQCPCHAIITQPESGMDDHA